MTVIIRNANDAQARRAMKRVLDAFGGWTWTSDHRADCGVLSVERLPAALYDREREGIEANQYDAEAPAEPCDVTVSTTRYTIATVLGVLTPAMRARAVMRSGQPAEDYEREVNAYQN